MAAGARKQLILEIDPDSDPIVGCLRDAEGHSFEFTGWLGFSSALGQALERAGEPAGRDGGPPRSADR